jgi:hypothetical protein
MSRHIIHKQTVRLELPSGEDVFAIQERVRSLFAGGLGDRLEALLDELAPPGRLIRLESLHLNLGSIDKTDLEDELRERLIGRLREAVLLTEKDPPAEDAVERPAAGIGAFLFFLSLGRLPWHSEIKDLSDWEGRLLGLPAAEWKQFPLWYTMQANRDMIGRRLASQFSDQFLAKMVALVRPGDDAAAGALVPEELVRMVRDLSASGQSNMREKIWTAVLDLILTPGPEGLGDAATIRSQVRSIMGRLSREREANAAADADRETALPMEAGDNSTPAGPEDVIDAVSADPGSPQETPREQPQELRRPRSLQEEDEGSLWASNSGIVILHPFLSALFTELGLVVRPGAIDGETPGRRFVSEDTAQRAVLLLHYLATGETTAPEFGLVLQKILCGLPPESPVPARLEPTEREREECRGVLEAVTQHWPPLNRTSVAGLQATFFQREGRLTAQDSGWTLKIEKKTVDILLDRLPWGISLVHLPWMEGMVSVEWTG